MSPKSGRDRVPGSAARGEEEAVEKQPAGLRKDREQAEQPQRVSRTLLSAVSHEMAQPLTVLRGSLELALEKEWSAKERRSWLEQALEQADRLIQVNVLLRELADAETVTAATEKASLSTLVNDLARDLLPMAEVQKMSLVVQCEDNLSVVANEKRLQQALVNVIGNAISRTPAEGTVRISLKRSGTEACLDISDTAPGLSPEELTQLFDPFYHSPTAPQGGIDSNVRALSVAKRIIETLNGTIRVESKTEQGKCFHIRLPLA